MAAACAFDRWRKDAFFPAAEAVQDSADIMESTYRMWMREREQAPAPESETFQELSRDLQATLGTAKWQLEEFDRAVKATYNNHLSEDESMIRHGQFVKALGSQISYVEKALNSSLTEGGKQPLRWIQLDHQECNDLAAFLSASQAENKELNGSSQIDQVNIRDNGKRCREEFTLNSASKHLLELELEEDAHSQASNRGLLEQQRRTWSSPDINDWKIVISEEYGSKGKALKNKMHPPLHFINLHGLIKNTRMAAKSKSPRRNFRGNTIGTLLSKNRDILSHLNVRSISRFAQGKHDSSPADCRSSCCEEGRGESQAPKTSGTIAAFRRPLQELRFFTQFQPLRLMLLLILAVFLIGRLTIFPLKQKLCISSRSHLEHCHSFSIRIDKADSLILFTTLEEIFTVVNHGLEHHHTQSRST